MGSWPTATMISPIWACKSLSLGEVTTTSTSRCGGIWINCNEVVLQLAKLGNTHVGLFQHFCFLFAFVFLFICFRFYFFHDGKGRISGANGGDDAAAATRMTAPDNGGFFTRFLHDLHSRLQWMEMRLGLSVKTGRPRVGGPSCEIGLMGNKRQRTPSFYLGLGPL